MRDLSLERDAIDLLTINHRFGSFRLTGEAGAVAPHFPALFLNAVQMLAVVLERNRQEELLREECARLQVLVEEKVASIRKSEALLNATQRLTRVGGWEWDVEAGAMHWTLECYRLHELDPEAFPPGSRELIEASTRCYRPEDVPVILAAFRRCTAEGLPYDLEFPFTTAKGRPLWIRTTALAVREEGRVVRVVGNILDITAQKKAEEELKASLREKEVLLKELYHRTKNNMQVICSLLELKAAGTRESAIVGILDDMGSRIKSMALVHAKLYQSRSLSRLDLGDYLRDLVPLLVSSRKAEGRGIGLSLELDTVEVLIDTAVPVGLLVNEVVTNALKYAFPAGKEGMIRVTLRRDGTGFISLSIADDGVGIPGTVDPLAGGTLGWQIITSIAREQLDGELAIGTGNGVRFDLRFAEAQYSERV